MFYTKGENRGSFMKKKLVLLLLMATLFAGGVSAQSLGAGILLIPSSAGFDIGPNVFLDLKYLEANVGLLFGNRKWESSDKGIDTTTLNLGLLGKLPIPLADGFVFFPFIGLDYDINLYAKFLDTGYEYKDDERRSMDWDHLSFLFGIGVDLGPLRFEIGYGIVFNTENQQNIVDRGGTYNNGKVPIKIGIIF
jgi:hypothetical protein